MKADRISAPVGTGCVNAAQDVRVVTALLNAVDRRAGTSLPRTLVPGTFSPALKDRILRFQTSLGHTRPDGIISPQGQTLRALRASLESVFAVGLLPLPAEGLLTWDAEGREGGLYHTRRLHVPSAASGLTVGRGYDMKFRTSGQIHSDLTAAGVGANDATLIAAAGGLSGQSAVDHIAASDLLDFVLAPGCQLALFARDYRRYASNAERLCRGIAAVAQTPGWSWGNLHARIRTIVTDLLYRGDLTRGKRDQLGAAIAANDLPAFSKLLSDRSRWSGVPSDRFQRRAAYLQ